MFGNSPHAIKDNDIAMQAIEGARNTANVLRTNSENLQQQKAEQDKITSDPNPAQGQTIEQLLMPLDDDINYTWEDENLRSENRTLYESFLAKQREHEQARLTEQMDAEIIRLSLRSSDSGLLEHAGLSTRVENGIPVIDVDRSVTLPQIPLTQPRQQQQQPQRATPEQRKEAYSHQFGLMQ